MAAILDFSAILKISLVPSFKASLKTPKTNFWSQNTEKVRFYIVPYINWLEAWYIGRRPDLNKFNHFITTPLPRNHIQNFRALALTVAEIIKVKDFMFGGGHLEFERHFENFTSVIFQSVPQNPQIQILKSKHQKLKILHCAIYKLVGGVVHRETPRPKKFWSIYHNPSTLKPHTKL